MIDLLDEMDLGQKASGTASENAALRDWAAKGIQRAPDNACHLCGQPPRLRCQSCDKPACGKDSWVMLGLCRTCATEDRMKLWHERNRAVGDDWLGQR